MNTKSKKPENIHYVSENGRTRDDKTTVDF